MVKTMKRGWFGKRAKALSQEFRIYNLNERPVITPTPASKTWMKPPYGYIKINFDAAVLNGRVGFGVIARNPKGFCYRGQQWF